MSDDTIRCVEDEDNSPAAAYIRIQERAEHIAKEVEACLDDVLYCSMHRGYGKPSGWPSQPESKLCTNLVLISSLLQEVRDQADRILKDL